MRTFLFFFLGALFFNAIGQTQTHVGIRLGGNISSAYIEHTVYTLNMSIDYTPGFQGGLMIKHFTKRTDARINAGIQLSVNYSEKGWRQKFDTDEPTYKAKISYLTIPIEFILYAGKKKTKLFATGGLFGDYAFNTNHGAAPDLDNLGFDDFYTYDLNRDNRMGYGLRGSGGFFREFSFGIIHVEGSFDFSLSNFIKIKDRADVSPDLSNNYVFGISVAYLISFGKLEI